MRRRQKRERPLSTGDARRSRRDGVARIGSGEGRGSPVPLALDSFIFSGASCNTRKRDRKIEREVLVADERVHARRRRVRVTARVVVVVVASSRALRRFVKSHHRRHHHPWSPVPRVSQGGGASRCCRVGFSRARVGGDMSGITPHALGVHRVLGALKPAVGPPGLGVPTSPRARCEHLGPARRREAPRAQDGLRLPGRRSGRRDHHPSQQGRLLAARAALPRPRGPGASAGSVDSDPGPSRGGSVLPSPHRGQQDVPRRRRGRRRPRRRRARRHVLPPRWPPPPRRGGRRRPRPTQALPALRLERPRTRRDMLAQAREHGFTPSRSPSTSPGTATANATFETASPFRQPTPSDRCSKPPVDPRGRLIFSQTQSTRTPRGRRCRGARETSGRRRLRGLPEPAFPADRRAQVSFIRDAFDPSFDWDDASGCARNGEIGVRWR